MTDAVGKIRMQTKLAFDNGRMRDMENGVNNLNNV